MYSQAPLALLATILTATVSASPQPAPASSSKSSSTVAAGSTGSGTTPAASSTATGAAGTFVNSFNALYAQGSKLIGQNQTWSTSNYSVLQVYANTGEDDSDITDNSTSTTTDTSQLPLVNMEIQWLPMGQNTTTVVDEVNFGYNSSDSLDSDYATIGAANGTNQWAYSIYPDAEDTSDNMVMDGSNGISGIDKALSILAAKSLPGPWDEITIQTPTTDPSNMNLTEANPTAWMTFASYGGNESVSYMVNPSSGRVLKLSD